MGEFSTQVGRAVQVLDAYYGEEDWKSKVDVDLLEINMENMCVLGQLFGNFYKGMDELGIPYFERYNLGLSLPLVQWSSWENDSQAWETLNEEWKAELVRK